jgi:hypothetical protein
VKIATIILGNRKIGDILNVDKSSLERNITGMYILIPKKIKKIPKKMKSIPMNFFM